MEAAELVQHVGVWLKCCVKASSGVFNPCETALCPLILLMLGLIGSLYLNTCRSERQVQAHDGLILDRLKVNAYYTLTSHTSFRMVVCAGQNVPGLSFTNGCFRTTAAEMNRVFLLCLISTQLRHYKSSFITLKLWDCTKDFFIYYVLSTAFDTLNILITVNKTQWF